jgi:uncharacterized membrane protein YfcA
MLQDILAVGGGSVVGFFLGLVGGGGSILAVPILLYVVGVASPHVAIGTSALAVSVNAFTNLLAHGRAGNVKWPCAFVFAVAGVAGAWAGSTLGKMMDGRHLILAFAGIMVIVGLAMLRPRQAAGNPDIRLSPYIGLRLALIGLFVGFLAGFFGIGGGFLVVPGIMAGSGMPILFAVGSSLLSVSLFGLTTAINYALAGWVDWLIAAKFIAGGVLGGWLGMKLAVRLALYKAALNRVFAGVIFATAIFVVYRSVAG